MEQPYTKNVTFPEYLMKQYTGKPDAGQGWFLLYLFLYSQVVQRHVEIILLPKHSIGLMKSSIMLVLQKGPNVVEKPYLTSPQKLSKGFF